MKNGRISQWNYETSLNYHGNWKPIRQYKNTNEIQWNLAWRQRTPPGHPPVQTVGEGKEDSAKEGRPSHTACNLSWTKVFRVEITNRFAPTKILKKAFSLVTLLFTLQDQYRQHQHKILVLKYSRITNKLTDSTVPPFKARLACASIVIHHICACSVVCTRVRITIISV